MKNYKAIIYNVLVLILILILFSFVYVNFYKILKSSSEININLSLNQNTGLKAEITNDLNELYYNENKINKIPNVSEADIVYQWFDKSINSVCYSSIIYNKYITDFSSVSFKRPVDVSKLPTIKFVDLVTLNKNDFVEGRKNIIFKFPNNETVQFCFKDDMYYFYEINATQNNSIEMSAVCFTNIVVMEINNYYNKYIFSNKSKINGTGFVLSNGKYKEVVFKDNLMFDNTSNHQVPLLKGNTFWYFLTPDSKIEYSN